MPTVFISSTSEDLKPYRDAARDAAIGAGLLPDMMEYFAATGRPSLAECLRKVSKADVVVAIVAHRYGWVPTDQPADNHKSITWLAQVRHGTVGSSDFSSWKRRKMPVCNRGFGESDVVQTYPLEVSGD